MMIEVKNLFFSYGKRKQKVFDDFSLALDKGSVYGLLGKNGTGKSTLLYLMTGLLRPQAGRVLYKGVDVSMRYPLTLQDMFLVPEEFALPSVSLKQYLKLNTPFYPNFSNELLSTCLRDFDMNEDIHLGELSMGQKKKAFMCFALATNTSLLVMDEPSNGLDIPSKSQFRKVIASGMTDEKSVIISTHQVRDIDSLLDHVVIIDGTRVLLNASVKTICDKVYFAEQGMNEPTSFSRIAMVMKREIMENWKTNLYRLIGIYAAFALVMILHMWTMSSGRSSQISFTTYCSNIMGTFVFIIGIASIAYAANIMENMITKEKRIAFLMLPATMIEKFVARFLIVTVGMAAAIIVAASLAEITRYLVLPLFNLPEAFHQSVLYHLLSMAAIDGEQVFRGSGSALNMSYQNWLGELCGWAFLVWSHSLYILGGSYWYKKPFFKTLGTLMLISILCSVL